MRSTFGQMRRVAGHLHRCRIEYQTMRDKLGYRPNLVWPRTFNEKVVHRKLGRPLPEWSTLADKMAVRSVVAARAGPQYLVDVLQVATAAEEISFDRLPDRFVVKATHGSGWSVLVRDKLVTPEAAVRARCGGWLHSTYGVSTHETWYHPIPRRLVVEPFLEDAGYDVPRDFKCWVFHGRVEYIQVDLNRFSDHTQTFYDRRWIPQSWSRACPRGDAIPRPARLAEMIDLAETLGAGIDFVRVDLYCLHGTELKFGEITLAPGAGWVPFDPPSADVALGRLW